MNLELGIVSSRVALLLRSAEIKPLFQDLCSWHNFFFLFFFYFFVFVFPFAGFSFGVIQVNALIPKKYDDDDVDYGLGGV